MDWRKVLTTGLVLFVFASLGTGMVGISFVSTEKRIAANEHKRLLSILNQIIPVDQYSNNLATDVLHTHMQVANAQVPVTVYRARRDQQPVAAILLTQTPQGYNGTIKLMVGIYLDGTIAGVRILTHKETPGLGDKIERQRSDWILGFNQRSLTDPLRERWRVKKDGGDFDQLTGATITPRAVVQAVRDALEYFTDHKTLLFADSPLLNAPTPQ